MFVSEVKTKELVCESVFENCINCGKYNTTSIFVDQKYLKLYWIPFIPIRKKVYTNCSYCGHVIKKNKFHQSLRYRFNDLRNLAKAPYWMYSGLVLFLLIGVFAITTFQLNSKRYQQYLNSPQKGDVYHIKAAPNYFTIYKVENVTLDTLFMKSGCYFVNKSNKLYELEQLGDSAFLPIPKACSKKKMKEMFKEGKIIAIIR